MARNYCNSIKLAIYKLYKVCYFKHIFKPEDIFEKLYADYLKYISYDPDLPSSRFKGVCILTDISENYTFKDYIKEFGLNEKGEKCASFDEFIENEYQDANIIRNIIYKSFDEEIANSIHLAYLNDICFDKTGKTEFMDVKITEEILGPNKYCCAFEIDGKHYCESTISDALVKIHDVITFHEGNL